MPEVTQIFLTPASILVGALGVARTEGLKTGVSALGLLSTGLWLWALGAPATLSMRLPLAWLPILFGLAWVVSLLIHGSRFNMESRRHVVELDADVARSFPDPQVVNHVLRAQLAAHALLAAQLGTDARVRPNPPLQPTGSAGG